MGGGGPPPVTSCDSTTLTTPSVSRPWMRMTIGMPRTLSLLPPSEGVWIGLIDVTGDVLSPCSGWQVNNLSRASPARTNPPRRRWSSKRDVWRACCERQRLAGRSNETSAQRQFDKSADQSNRSCQPCPRYLWGQSRRREVDSTLAELGQVCTPLDKS